MTAPEPYEVDDRGNVAQFYEVSSGEIIATLDREAEVNGVPDQSTWDGDPDVTAWAIANGYEGAIADATRIYAAGGGA